MLDVPKSFRAYNRAEGHEPGGGSASNSISNNIILGSLIRGTMKMPPATAAAAAAAPATAATTIATTAVTGTTEKKGLSQISAKVGTTTAPTHGEGGAADKTHETTNLAVSHPSRPSMLSTTFTPLGFGSTAVFSPLPYSSSLISPSSAAGALGHRTMPRLNDSFLGEDDLGHIMLGPSTTNTPVLTAQGSSSSSSASADFSGLHRSLSIEDDFSGRPLSPTPSTFTSADEDVDPRTVHHTLDSLNKCNRDQLRNIARVFLMEGYMSLTGIKLIQRILVEQPIDPYTPEQMNPEVLFAYKALRPLGRKFLYRMLTRHCSVKYEERPTNTSVDYIQAIRISVGAAWNEDELSLEYLQTVEDDAFANIVVPSLGYYDAGQPPLPEGRVAAIYALRKWLNLEDPSTYSRDTLNLLKKDELKYTLETLGGQVTNSKATKLDIIALIRSILGLKDDPRQARHKRSKFDGIAVGENNDDNNENEHDKDSMDDTVMSLLDLNEAARSASVGSPRLIPSRNHTNRPPSSTSVTTRHSSRVKANAAKVVAPPPATPTATKTPPVLTTSSSSSSSLAATAEMMATRYKQMHGDETKEVLAARARAAPTPDLMPSLTSAASSRSGTALSRPHSQYNIRPAPSPYGALPPPKFASTGASAGAAAASSHHQPPPLPPPIVHYINEDTDHQQPRGGGGLNQVMPNMVSIGAHLVEMSNAVRSQKTNLEASRADLILKFQTIGAAMQNAKTDAEVERATEDAILARRDIREVNKRLTTMIELVAHNASTFRPIFVEYQTALTGQNTPLPAPSPLLSPSPNTTAEVDAGLKCAACHTRFTSAPIVNLPCKHMVCAPCEKDTCGACTKAITDKIKIDM